MKVSFLACNPNLRRFHYFLIHLSSTNIHGKPLHEIVVGRLGEVRDTSVPERFTA